MRERTSWTRLYRVALLALPAALRRKHGDAMTQLFEREVARARARGVLHAALVAAAGIGDALRRGAYEQTRDPEHVHHSTGASPVPYPTTRQLVGRHAVSFVIAFAAMTAILLANFASRQAPALSARGLSATAIGEAILLALPFTAAMTIPMAVLVAVLWVFTRLGADGTLAEASRRPRGLRRLLAPVLCAALVACALALAVNLTVVPRANARLAAVLAGRETRPSDRTMTIPELREAARRARGNDPLDAAPAAAYEVEIQKKLALPFACVVMTLVGAAIALRVQRGGALLVIGGSLVVFGAYYVAIVTGEHLADQLVVSPFVGMWGANALLLLAALPALWWRPGPRASQGVPVTG